MPGNITKAFADLAGAEAEAMDLTNLMLSDNGQAKSANASNWRAKVEALQDEHGAAHCYVEIAEHVVVGAVPDPVAHALRRAESFIAGFEDDESQDGILDLLASIRAAIAGAPADPVRDAAPQMLAALKEIITLLERESRNPRWIQTHPAYLRAISSINRAEGRANG
ncbi:hypothetical protein QOZ99_001792 [Angulomicrobium amanitiforme]|uniref:Uncharacterized protein n=1 Tax=Ancylobacter amanitiformis TaxID=217069 RepID=A0ABU0LQC4_9HYPH|nr:hypothetical protein [Ancylobacter amanitiformis]